MKLVRGIRIGPRLAGLLASAIVLLAAIAFGGLGALPQLVDQNTRSHNNTVQPKPHLGESVEYHGEARPQILPALAHLPSNPFATLHDHAITLHLDIVAKRNVDGEPVWEQVSNAGNALIARTLK